MCRPKRYSLARWPREAELGYTHTFQSKRHKMQHYARPDARLAKARRLGFQAWRKRDEAERLAIPPREPDPVPGQEVYRITVECAGSMHIITAHWPRASGVRRPGRGEMALPVSVLKAVQ